MMTTRAISYQLRHSANALAAFLLLQSKTLCQGMLPYRSCRERRSRTRNFSAKHQAVAGVSASTFPALTSGALEIHRPRTYLIPDGYLAQRLHEPLSHRQRACAGCCIAK
jgi:hypothetical protein